VPWSERSIMSQREEFMSLFSQAGANRRELCRRFKISPTLGYRLLERYRRDGVAGLADRSRRPQHSPDRTPEAMEAAVLAVRDANPAWGGRKIRRCLTDLGRTGVPSMSTITAILHRHQRIDAAESSKHRAWQRFERPAPNELWQMDFKGHFEIGTGRCHPLTIVDDHSRYSIGIRACSNERETTVRRELTATFRCYGLPERMLMDNGPPWGTPSAEHTALTVWLMQLGIAISHGRPHHPQTQGKEERFHRTLQAEVIGRRAFRDLLDCQRHFDDWRIVYNTVRPHQAIDLATPATRYRPSRRGFPETLAPFDYGHGAIVRRVDAKGRISYRGLCFKIGKAFAGYLVALRPSDVDGSFDVHFQHHRLAGLNLREPTP
jgi:transposase InsO family protein